MIQCYSTHREDQPCRCNNAQENFEVKKGHFTVARIDRDHGKYSIVAGECDSAEGPYIHHVSEVEGALTEEIREFCKYVPAIAFDPVK